MDGILESLGLSDGIIAAIRQWMPAAVRQARHNTLVYCATGAVVLGAYIVYVRWPLSGLQHTGLPGPPPSVYTGNMSTLMKEVMSDVHLRWKAQYGKTYIIHEGRFQAIVFFDREDIKELTVKRAHEFSNRRKLPLRGCFRYTLIDLVDNEWRRVRNILSPIFSGNKMKQMFPLIVEKTDQFLEHLQSKCDSDEPVDLKVESHQYTLSVICSTAFGLDVNTYMDPDNIVYKNANDCLEFNFKNPWFIMLFFFPFLTPVLEYAGIAMPEIPPMLFIRQFAIDAVKQREASGIERPDAVQFMVKARKLHVVEQQLQQPAAFERKGLNDDEIGCQLLVFMFAGFDTVSTGLSFMLFLLANHPDCQDKAIQEVDDLFEKYGDVTYDNIWELKYVSMCMMETLRLYTPIYIIDRRSTKDVDLHGLHIPANTPCVIPVAAIHRDPELWEDPEQFIPERHSKPIDQYQFFPFGLGPRNCIGMRLAQMEIKIAVAKILKNYRIVTCEKTKPIELEPQLLLRTKGGLWVKLQKREV